VFFDTEWVTLGQANPLSLLFVLLFAYFCSNRAMEPDLSPFITLRRKSLSYRLLHANRNYSAESELRPPGF
jgi:hypothetical protein